MPRVYQYMIDKWDAKFVVSAHHRYALKKKEHEVGTHLNPIKAFDTRYMTLKQILSPAVFKKYDKFCRKKFKGKHIYYRIRNVPPYRGICNWERDMLKHRELLIDYFTELFSGEISEERFMEIERLRDIRSLRAKKSEYYKRARLMAHKHSTVDQEQDRIDIEKIGKRLNLDNPFTMSIKDVENLR